MSTIIGNLVSVNEAAEILGCTVSRVRQMLRAEEIPGMKLNQKAWALRRQDVQKAAKRHYSLGRPRISKKTN